ncbi:MAG: hypothetical protein VW405_23475, partial [Rhodospirillaceae bacterium]
AIVLPADAISSALFISANPGGITEASPARVIAIFLIVYVMRWVLFPLVMAVFSDAIQRSERFVLFVVAHNWANVVRAVILLPAVAIFAIEGIGNPGWGAAIYFAALIGVFVYAWFVARVALDTTVAAAITVVVIELGVALILSGVKDWMTGRV